MCISLIASKYVTIKLLIENIFLSLHDGTLKAHEVYDVFFTLKEPWKDARILGVSPHDLLHGKSLNMRSVTSPGAGGPDDIFYKDAVLYTVLYNENDNDLSISVPSGNDEFLAETECFRGTVIRPDILIPKWIAQDKLALELMKEAGTVFELALGDLEAHVDYVFRLIIDPEILQGMPEKRTQDIEEVDEIVSNWVQDGVISCPKNCRFNFLSQIAEGREVPEYAEASATIQGVVADSSMRLMPVRRRYIVLVVPRRAELIGKTSEGLIWAVSTHTLSDGRPAAVWAAGADQYWIDDPESVADRIYRYCMSWALARPKTKEEVSIAIGTSHENCSLVINALCKYGGIAEAGDAKYRPLNHPKAKLEEIFEKVAATQEVVKNFRWKGYQIRYSVHYRYATIKDVKRIRWLRWKRTIAFWGGILGTFIGIISLLFALLK